MTPRLVRFRPGGPSRGVTLIEMLVSVALLVLMMAVLVQVFTAATGAVTSSRAYQELDGGLRQLDSTVRQDLSNVTAKLTPPLNPKDHLGYFEYAENSFADLQGEDCDDTLRFTVKAPEGQLFTGRMYLAAPTLSGGLSNAQVAAYRRRQPITVTSQFAEIIYFLRNGNLYRRVLLVAPERQPTVFISPGNVGYIPGILNANSDLVTPPFVGTSFIGVNDFSARPNPSVDQTSNSSTSILLLNTLGDLTNRENRYASPRFANDLLGYDYTGTLTYSDGKPDDQNTGGAGVGDGVPDYYPTLYPNLFSASGPGLVNEFGASSYRIASYVTMPFPFVYPGAYSVPHQFSAANALGWIHSPDANNPQNSLFSLNTLNHNPVEIGDSLPNPVTTTSPLTAWTWRNVTWWGFPSWRETMNPAWSDLTTQLASNTAIGAMNATPGLTPLDPSVYNPPAFTPDNILPPMTAGPLTWGGTTTNTPYRVKPQAYSDGAGSPYFAANQNPAFASNPDVLWKQTWEDDLVMTNVRSFDVKAYDNSFGGYVDLGWGDDLRLYQPYKPPATLTANAPPYLGLAAAGALPLVMFWPPLNDATWPPSTGGAAYNLLTQTYAHEGRIPPRTVDNRVDPQYPVRLNGTAANLGDDVASVIRLRRVWDTWSTDYTNAPATGFNPSTRSPIGPPFTDAIYPSYPPPYPMPLRGLQIQIRVTDPRNERVKTLTIRQDFSDKL